MVRAPSAPHLAEYDTASRSTGLHGRVIRFMQKSARQPRPSRFVPATQSMARSETMIFQRNLYVNLSIRLPSSFVAIIDHLPNCDEQ
jgi:hypothetical protein